MPPHKRLRTVRGLLLLLLLLPLLRPPLLHTQLVAKTMRRATKKKTMVMPTKGTTSPVVVAPRVKAKRNQRGREQLNIRTSMRTVDLSPEASCKQSKHQSHLYGEGVLYRN
jgi:hypothetical protein